MPTFTSIQPHPLFFDSPLSLHCAVISYHICPCIGTPQAQADLNQEASAVSEINLNHAVRQAISASNAKYDDEDVIDRVRARKNKSAAGGWTKRRAGVGGQQRGAGDGQGQGLWAEEGRVSSGLRARTGS